MKRESILCMLLTVQSLAALGIGGCAFPSDRLSFPARPISASEGRREYDTGGDGKADFAIARGEGDAGALLEYDDDQDGTPDRAYRMGEADQGSTPHLIILFDSIPYEPVAERWSSAEWFWFASPARVVPPFPTMSPVIFASMLHAPAQHGAINRYYDRLRQKRVDRISERARGDANPWERRLHYRLDYWENGLAFLSPRRWLRVDLARAKAAFDSSPDRVTVVYLASTACMLSKHGRMGLEECLDGLEQLCAQVLHERRGRVNISVLADHGHNLVPGERVDVPRMLEEAGFHARDSLQGEDDVVVELDGLVNYVGIHTRKAAEVAAALAQRPEIELVMYLEAAPERRADDAVSPSRVIVRSAAGEAAVEHRAAQTPGDSAVYRYVPLSADVLGYASVVEKLRSEGQTDAGGFAAADAWLSTTIDHRWPDAPRRLWQAFNGIVVHTPDVMLVTRRGYYAGQAKMDWWIDMASTHGGLDYDDSVTFLLTTTGRVPVGSVLRTEDAIRAVEPGYDPDLLRR